MGGQEGRKVERNASFYNLCAGLCLFRPKSFSPETVCYKGVEERYGMSMQLTITIGADG